MEKEIKNQGNKYNTTLILKAREEIKERGRKSSRIPEDFELYLRQWKTLKFLAYDEFDQVFERIGEMWQNQHIPEVDYRTRRLYYTQGRLDEEAERKHSPENLIAN